VTGCRFRPGNRCRSRTEPRRHVEVAEVRWRYKLKTNHVVSCGLSGLLRLAVLSVFPECRLDRRVELLGEGLQGEIPREILQVAVELSIRSIKLLSLRAVCPQPYRHVGGFFFIQAS